MFWGLALGNLAIALVLVPRYPISEIVSSVTVFLNPGRNCGRIYERVRNS